MIGTLDGRGLETRAKSDALENNLADRGRES